MSPSRSTSTRKIVPDGREKSSTRSRDPLGGSPGNFCMKTSRHDLILTELLALGLIALMSPSRSMPKQKRAPDGRQKSSARSRDPSRRRSWKLLSKHDLILTELLGLGLVA